MVLGEQMMSQVVHVVGASPDWPSTLLVTTYDEGGRYCDHVPPPPALAPDAIRIQLRAIKVGCRLGKRYSNY